jgi:hypothetical protein
VVIDNLAAVDRPSPFAVGAGPALGEPVARPANANMVNLPGFQTTNAGLR